MALDYKLAPYPLSERMVQMQFPQSGKHKPGEMLTVGVAEFSGETGEGLKIKPFNGVVVAIEQKDGPKLSFDLHTSSARMIGEAMIRMADAVDAGWKPEDAAT